MTIKLPKGAAVAWDTYLKEPVEVCEVYPITWTVVCRRIFPHVSYKGTSYESDSDGVMMELPMGYFKPMTPLARELLLLAGWTP